MRENLPRNEPSMRHQVQLADIILAGIVPDDSSADNHIDYQTTKAYAIACSKMIGLLAGLSLQENIVDAAIDEVLEIAKENAHTTIKILKMAGFERVPLNEGPKKPSNSQPADAQKEQVIAMAVDLENQAKNEKNPATAAALRIMAANMRRELANESTPEKNEVA